MAKKKVAGDFVLCLKNDAYPASLEVRKVYRRLPDPRAAAKSFVRVIDESGEDYLYPADFFVPIELPKVAEDVFIEVS
jgi:hypothetical protein